VNLLLGCSVRSLAAHHATSPRRSRAPGAIARPRVRPAFVTEASRQRHGKGWTPGAFPSVAFDAVSTPSDPERHPHGRVVRVLVAVSASIALVVSLASGFSFVRWIDVQDAGVDENILRNPIVPTESPGSSVSPPPRTSRCSEEPCNYLILGSDSRIGLSAEEQVQFGTDKQIGGENRADTIMLVHVDPALEKSIILSFPRDLWVEIPKHGFDKINAAFEGGISGGGADLMAQTVANLTGLKVDHVLYVDLAGFQGIVDTLDGVDMCIPAYNANPATGRLQDPLTGLDIEPGCQRLDGQQALAYVRTRALPCDTIPDFARIGRQQQFLRAVINQMLQPGKLLRAPTLIEPILENMRRDPRFKVGDLVYLVRQLEGLTTGAAEFRSVPGHGAFVEGLSVVKMDPSARQIFQAIREGRQISGVGETLISTPPSEANIEIAAVDAGNAPAAGKAYEVLLNAGFAVDPEIVQPDDVGLKQRNQSIIAYAPGRDAEASVVRSYLPQLKVFESEALEGHDVAVVVADDYRPAATGDDATIGQCPEAA
jgi:LCP family protein required for cell wall assembly